MTEQRKRYQYTERLPLIVAELQRLNRPATREELYEALRTEPNGLFGKRRRLDATIRDDQKQMNPVLRLEGRQIALRKPSYDVARTSPGPAESKVYERGQTVVPKKIRDAMRVEEGSTLVWEVQEGIAQVIVVPTDPIRGAIGILKGTGPTFEEFLADRNAERARERELEADEERRWRSYSTRQQS